MKSRFALLPVAAILAATLPIHAQTATKSTTTPAAKPATASSSTATKTATAYSAVKLPPGVPPARGIVKNALPSFKYQDTKIGTGPVGEDGKVWHVKYTGWRAADGVKFDSWEKHPQPIIENGKPKLGADGKPILGDPKPIEFLHGVGRMIPGFDLGVEGMRIGGKRRIFIPWALAYGVRPIPDRGPDHPGIPAKSDLIFDVELVDVTDPPPPPPPMQRPGLPPGATGISPGQPGAPRPGIVMPAPKPTTTPGQPAAPATAPAPQAAPAPATTPAPATAPKPTTPQSK